MSDINIDKLLRELSNLARTDSLPAVDVRSSVLQTLAAQSQPVRVDLTQVAFTAVSVAVAASVVIALLPAWQTMSEPWVCLLP